MKVPKHTTLARRMPDARMKKLAQTGPLMAESLVQSAKQCCGRAAIARRVRNMWVGI